MERINCKACGAPVEITTDRRPIEVMCPSCGEIEMITSPPKKKMAGTGTVVCNDCGMHIVITTTKRPIEVMCPSCGETQMVATPPEDEDEEESPRRRRKPIDWEVYGRVLVFVFVIFVIIFGAGILPEWLSSPPPERVADVQVTIVCSHPPCYGTLKIDGVGTETVDIESGEWTYQDRREWQGRECLENEIEYAYYDADVGLFDAMTVTVCDGESKEVVLVGG